MIEKERLIDYQNKLREYITNTFFSDEKIFKNFLESKSVLTVLTEISSLSHRYSQSGDEKLKRLLVKQCIILLFQLEVIIKYSGLLTNLGIDYPEINLESPTIYSPFRVSDTEINLADTIGKMCCNLSMGIWNDFNEKDYSTIALIARIRQITEKSFGLFLLELGLYIDALLIKQPLKLINDILPNAFYIKNKNDKVLNFIKNIKRPDKKAPPKEHPKITIIEQPSYEVKQTEDKPKINEEKEGEFVEEDKQEEIPVEAEPVDEIFNRIDEQVEQPSQEFNELVRDKINEVVGKEIILKESYIGKDGELEESKIKTTIIKG